MCTVQLLVENRGVNRAGPNAGRAECGPGWFGPGRPIVLLASNPGPDYQSFKDPGRIQFKDQF